MMEIVLLVIIFLPYPVSVATREIFWLQFVKYSFCNYSVIPLKL